VKHLKKTKVNIFLLPSHAHQIWSKLALSVILIVFLASCRPSQPQQGFSLEEFSPLTSGRNITYRIDSLVFTQFGRQVETRSYLMRYTIDSSFLDNQGRKSYRIIRMIRDTLQTQPWRPDGSFYITSTPSQMEWIEDNLRQVKLQTPLRPGAQWNGNRFLANNPLYPTYDFSYDDNIQNWIYTLSAELSSFQYRNKRYENVITVMQIDEAVNVPITIPTSYAFRNYAVDRFAKNIGLVYREHIIWENQPRQRASSTPPHIIVTYDPVRLGFGVKMWMINKN
jgi:hypothetical protein